MLYELNETLECIIPFVYHLDPIVVENPRTPIEVEWQTQLVRFRAFIPWFEIEVLRT
jgi:hypothetical protein